MAWRHLFRSSGFCPPCPDCKQPLPAKLPERCPHCGAPISVKLRKQRAEEAARKGLGLGNLTKGRNAKPARK